MTAPLKPQVLPAGQLDDAGLSLGQRVAGQFFDNAPCPIMLLDEKGNLLDANKPLLSWMGLDRFRPLQTASVRDLLGLKDEAAMGQLISQVAMVERGMSPLPLDLVLTRQDGSEMTVAVATSALRSPSGEFLACAVSLYDITERRRIEDLVLKTNLELEESAAKRMADLSRTKRRFDLMADALQDSCIFFLAPDGRISEWSESANRLHGFTREQVTGLPFGSLRANDKGDDDEISSEDAVHMAVQRGQWELRGWFRRAEGEPFWGHVLITVLRGDDEQLEGLSCITRDRTAAKDLDTVMNDLNGELERRVSERVRQHIVPNRDLDVFTHHITHDLRAPLRHINTFAGLIVEDLGDNASEDMKRYRDGLRKGVRRLDAMVEAMLNFARVGRVDIHPSPLRMSTLIENVISRVMRNYPGLDVKFHVQDDLPIVIADPMMITDMLLHVMDNAVKFSSRVAKPEIQVGWCTEGESLGQFFIVDNGIGFDMAKATKLFVMFARQHHSLDYEGNGTGLAIAQRIVQRHSGRIWIDSTPNHGCALHFTLQVDSSLTPSGLADLGL